MSNTETKEIKEIAINGEVYNIKDTTARSPEWENVGYNDVDIISEMTVELQEIMPGMYSSPEDPAIPVDHTPIDNYEYMVMFNGVSYNCVYKDSVACLGNVYKLGELTGDIPSDIEDTGEPFLIGFNGLGGVVIFVFENLSDLNISIQVHGKTLQTIPPEFLPEEKLVTLNLNELGMPNLNQTTPVSIDFSDSELLINAVKKGVINLVVSINTKYQSIFNPTETEYNHNLQGVIYQTAIVTGEISEYDNLINCTIITYYDSNMIYLYWSGNTIKGIIRPLAFNNAPST